MAFHPYTQQVFPDCMEVQFYIFLVLPDWIPTSYILSTELAHTAFFLFYHETAITTRNIWLIKFFQIKAADFILCPLFFIEYDTSISKDTLDYFGDIDKTRAAASTKDT
ncbi:MAG: hypothetical protein RR131_08070, partial [Anaerovorax sp.]